MVIALLKLKGAESVDPALTLCAQYQMLGFRPVIAKMIASTRPTTNRMYAIELIVPAIPERPRTPAMIAMMKKVSAQLSIIFLLYINDLCVAVSRLCRQERVLRMP